MSPKNIKFNYFFDEPAAEEKKPSEYLHYSIEDDMYVQFIEESNFDKSDLFQRGALFEPKDVLEQKISDKDAVGFVWGYAEVEAGNNVDDDFYNLTGNNLTDLENIFDV